MAEYSKSQALSEVDSELSQVIFRFSVVLTTNFESTLVGFHGLIIIPMFKSF